MCFLLIVGVETPVRSIHRFKSITYPVLDPGVVMPRFITRILKPFTLNY